MNELFEVLQRIPVADKSIARLCKESAESEDAGVSRPCIKLLPPILVKSMINGRHNTIQIKSISSFSIIRHIRGKE
jgi:hypothetical protein